MFVAADSKGISVYNFSGWHERITTDRKYKGLKRYRKFHVMMDLETRDPNYGLREVVRICIGR